MKMWQKICFVLLAIACMNFAATEVLADPPQNPCNFFGLIAFHDFIYTLCIDRAKLILVIFF